MKRFVLGCGLCLLLQLFNLGSNAQANKAPGDDSSAVRETVRNYIEGYYTGDAQRMATNPASSLSEARASRQHSGKGENW